jgi:osmotically inducible protein OsmC
VSGLGTRAKIREENEMALRTGEAEWDGTIREGKGRMRLGSGAFEGAYSYRSRMEDGPGTNPEELIAAAHAGCFSMALSAGLSRAGYEPRRIHTDARVRFEPVEGGFAITRIDLETEAEVPGIDEESFREQAETAKTNCPVSKALAGVEIGLEARLV